MTNRGGTVSGTMIYAAPYIRQSRRKANKSEASPEDQRDQTGKYIASVPGAVLVGAGLYEDIGVSGYDPNAERKGFERLLNDCRAGRVNMIVVHYASRFSRQNYNVVLMQMLELFSLGVRIVSVNEGEFKNDNVMDLMNIIMRFEANHNESRNKSIAVKGTFEKARAAGGWVGGHAPYGFTVERRLSKGIAIQVLVPHTTPHKVGPKLSESDVVRLMCQTIRAGFGTEVPRGERNPASLLGVVEMLNEKGIPCRGATKGGVHKDARWAVSTINRCLRDPRLAGYVAEREARNGHKYRIIRDEDGSPLIADYEPIIPREEWWELQEWLDGRGQGRGLYRHDSLLSGLRNADGASVLQCSPGCDKPMSSYTPSASSTTQSRNYRCNYRDSPGHKGNNSMVQHHLDDYVASRILSRIAQAHNDPDMGDLLAEATKRFASTVTPTTDLRERTRLVTERHEASQALQEAEADYKSVADKGPAVRRAVLEEMDRAEKRLAALDGALRALEDAAKPLLPIDLWCGDGDGNLTGSGSWWDGASLADRRTFVALFVDRVVVHKTGLRGNRWKTYDAGERVTLTWAGEDVHSAEAAA